MVCGKTRDMVSFISFPGQRNYVRTHGPLHALSLLYLPYVLCGASLMPYRDRLFISKNCSPAEK